MSAWHRRFSSQALTGFTKGEPLPYRMEDGVVVSRVTPREGFTWGTSQKHSTVHLIRDMAGAWTPEGFIVGARWLCGASSIGARVIDDVDYWDTWEKAYRNGGAESKDDVVCAKCRAVRDGVSERPCVYRCWGKDGRLLYIGSTKSWAKRRTQHRAKTWWWPAVKTLDLEHFDSLGEARASEAAAIRAERPQMNVMHNKGASA